MWTFFAFLRMYELARELDFWILTRLYTLVAFVNGLDILLFQLSHFGVNCLEIIDDWIYLLACGRKLFPQIGDLGGILFWRLFLLLVNEFDCGLSTLGFTCCLCFGDGFEGCFLFLGERFLAAETYVRLSLLGFWVIIVLCRLVRGSGGVGVGLIFDGFVFCFLGGFRFLLVVAFFGLLSESWVAHRLLQRRARLFFVSGSWSWVSWLLFLLSDYRFGRLVVMMALLWSSSSRCSFDSLFIWLFFISSFNSIFWLLLFWRLRQILVLKLLSFVNDVIDFFFFRFSFLSCFSIWFSMFFLNFCIIFIISLIVLSYLSITFSFFLFLNCTGVLGLLDFLLN